ncbi:MAG TPA: iron-sulfur cluster assembly scaffold protein [Steroidobacteraceae bacterium]|jgi:NifU-like protein involved in Fe-S cluster formation
MNYSELTRRYFESAANAGELAGPGVFRGAAGNREQGTWVQFDLQIKAGAISAAKFLAFACPHTIAVAAWLAERAAGRAVEALLPESVQALRERFAVPVEKMGRLLIIEDAWLAAVRPAIDYRENTHMVIKSDT